MPGGNDNSSRPPARPEPRSNAVRQLADEAVQRSDTVSEPGAADRRQLVELNARRREAVEQLRGRKTVASLGPDAPHAATAPSDSPLGEAVRPALNDLPVGSPLEQASPRPSDAATRRFGLPPAASGAFPAARPAARPAALPAAMPPFAAPLPPVAGRQGDPFWRIWLEHREHLRRQSLRLMSGNQADAEDALSVAMLKASQKFAEYADSIVNERAWLSRLLHNACMDVYRAQRKQARWIADQPVENDDGEIAGQPLAAAERSPEELALGREQLEQLQEQVVQLPVSLRRPFLMRFVQNLSYDEIAAELNLTNAAVRKRIQLARERLRRGLSW